MRLGDLADVPPTRAAGRRCRRARRVQRQREARAHDALAQRGERLLAEPCDQQPSRAPTSSARQRGDAAARARASTTRPRRRRRPRGRRCGRAAAARELAAGAATSVSDRAGERSARCGRSSSPSARPACGRASAIGSAASDALTRAPPGGSARRRRARRGGPRRPRRRRRQHHAVGTASSAGLVVTSDRRAAGAQSRSPPRCAPRWRRRRPSSARAGPARAGARQSARASATRWRCPPESERPRAATALSSPSGHARHDLVGGRRRERLRQRVCPPCAPRIASRSVPSNSVASCSATSTAARSASGSKAASGTPSNVMAPASGSASRPRQLRELGAVRGVERGHADELAGGDSEAHAGNPPPPHVAQQKRAGALRVGSPIAALDRRRRAEEGRDAPRRRPRARQLRTDPAEPRERPDEELREPERRDQAAEAERALGRQPSADERDRGEQHARASTIVRPRTPHGRGRHGSRRRGRPRSPAGSAPRPPPRRRSP